MKHRLACWYPFKGCFHADRTTRIWVAVDSRKVAACYLEADAMAGLETMTACADFDRIFVDAVGFDQARLIESVSEARADDALLNVQ